MNIYIDPDSMSILNIFHYSDQKTKEKKYIAWFQDDKIH